MDRLNNLADYFKEKDRKKLDALVKSSSNGLPEMTAAEVKQACVENNGYETPELNDKLYLHFRGFKKIENLELYTGCKAIWLDSNGFDKIENLETMLELRCLYLSKNLINSISGLETLKLLTLLDLSNNRIHKIENLACCPQLQTINVSRNYLSVAESIAHFQECPLLNNIDITNNRLLAEDPVLEIFPKIPSLVALSINGNEITKLQSFRKRLIAFMPKLGYLDRPVDELERLTAEAFMRGGVEAETACRDKWREDQNEKRRSDMAAFKQWQQEQAQVRAVAREQGRSLISEFSPEEQAARAEAARLAAQAERRMLEHGVDNVASKYWQLEQAEHNRASLLPGQGRFGPRRSDVFDEVDDCLTEQDVAEYKAQQQAHTWPPRPPTERELSEECVASNSASCADAPVPDTHAHSPNCVSIPIIEEDDDDQEEGEHQQQEEAAEHGKLTADVEQEPEEQVHETQLSRAEEEQQQRVREQRVAESLEIYKRQLQSSAQGKLSSSASHATATAHSLSSSSHSSSWQDHSDSSHSSTSSSSSSSVNSAPRTLYWSETMDIQLARSVRAHVFDFDQVSASLTAADCRKAGSLPLTAAACRDRWAQLDADKWSAPAPNHSGLETVFKVCVQPTALGQGHGAQPSYHTMASAAASGMPAYLTPPSHFPSVADAPSDDDEEDQDDDEEDQDDDEEDQDDEHLDDDKLAGESNSAVEHTGTGAAAAAEGGRVKAKHKHKQEGEATAVIRTAAARGLTVLRRTPAEDKSKLDSLD